MSKLNKKHQSFADEYIIGLVYLITNQSNKKKYVGITTRTVEQRFEEHCKSDSYLGSAIRKYGKESFSISIIDSAKSKAELFEKEIKWIEQLGTFGKSGYNLTRGGDGVNNKKELERTITEEQREFIDMVTERNKEKLDVKNSSKVMEMIVLNMIQIFLLCRYRSEIISSVKLFSKLSEEYLKKVDEYNIINLQDVYEYYPQRKSSLGVFLSNGK